MIPGRNDNMCSRRWNKLCKHQLPAVKAAIQLKKSVFQTNFVDRAKERPAIAPRDLIALVQSKDDGSGENTRDRSRKQTKENLAVSNIVDSSTAPDFVAADTVSKTISRRPRRKSTGQKSKKQTEENVAVPDGLNDLSSGCSRSRKRKSTTASNAALQKRMRGSISLDNEAVPIELRGTDSANIEVGTNRIMDPVSVGEEGVVKKRTRRSKPARGNAAEQNIMAGSIPVGNEAIPVELRGTVSTNNVVGTNTMMDPVSVGDEGVVKKRARRSKPAGSEGATRKRRCSISADNEVGTNMTKDPVSGEEGVVKKRTKRSKPVGNEGAARKKMRASVPVGDEGAVKKTGSVATENHGGVTKRKRAPSRRKSAGDNLTTEDVANASSELGLPSTPSEERVVDAANINKGRRKSTPRPKQIDMSEGDADKHSPSTRLANCLSFARMKGIDRNTR